MVTQINKYDGTVLVEIANNTLDTNYSLKLPGTGYKNYGSPVLDDMVWLMEHFSNTTAPVNPIKGQIWYDTTGGVLKLYNGAAWTTSGSIVSNSTAPAAPVTGTLWWDVTHQLLKTWDGSAWTAIGPVAQIAFWNGVQNNAPAADNTYPLGNVNSRFSTIYTTRQDTSGDSVVGGMLGVTGTTTLGEVVAKGNVQVRGNLVAQNGILLYNGLVVNGGVTIHNVGLSLTVEGSAQINEQVGIGKATDPFYWLDVKGPVRGLNEIIVENSGYVYNYMRDNNAPNDSKIWGKLVDDDGNYREYVCNDTYDPLSVNNWLHVNRTATTINEIQFSTGLNNLAITIDSRQNLVVNAGNLTLANAAQNIVFGDNTSMSTAGSWNPSVANKTIVTGGTMKNSGWQQFPSGMIMQWGFVDFESPLSEGLCGPFTFPIQFPRSFRSISLTTVTPEHDTATQADGDNQINIPYNVRPSTSEFYVWNNAISDKNSSLGFYWQAIGY